MLPQGHHIALKLDSGHDNYFFLFIKRTIELDIMMSTVVPSLYGTSYTLLQQAQEGKNQQALEKLLNVYHNYIYVVIRNMGVVEQEAEEILQNVSVEIWKYLPDYVYTPGKSKFRSWIAKIARNQALMFLRSKSVHTRNQKAIKGHFEYIEGAKSSPSEIDHIIEQQWQEFLLNLAIDGISKSFTPNALEAFRRFSSGQSVAKISAELGVSTDSVYKYISRIKKKLIDEMKARKRELDF